MDEKTEKEVKSLWKTIEHLQGEVKNLRNDLNQATRSIRELKDGG